jgi:hypothetical protein
MLTGYAACNKDNEWPRVESNHRTQIRSLPLYPLSYGAPPQCKARGSPADPLAAGLPGLQSA